MTSYNHHQHAPGPWHHSSAAVIGHDNDNDLDRDPRAISVDSVIGKADATAPMQTQTLDVAEGAWKGVVSIPRAVSQDQSDEEFMSNSNAGYSSSSTQTPSYYSRGGEFSSPRTATIPEHEESPLPVSSVPRHHSFSIQRGQQLHNMSALTHRSGSSSGSNSLSFAGMGRYTDADANGTAYYSAGGFHIPQENDEDDTSHATPKFNIMESSMAISLSPSPVRSVGDIFQSTSLTPARMMNAADKEKEENNHNNQEEVAAAKKSIQDSKQESQAPSSLSSSDQQPQQQEFYASCHSTQQTPSSPDHASSTVRDFSPSHEGTSAVNQAASSSSWGSTIHQITEQSVHPDASSSIGNRKSQQPSLEDSTSWGKGHSSHQMSSISHDISSLKTHQVSSSSSQKAISKEVSSWRSSSIFDSMGGKEELNESINKDEEEEQENQQPPATEETKNDNSFQPSDPLYQLQKLSHSSINRQDGTANPLFSPLPPSNSNPPAKRDVNTNNSRIFRNDDTSVNISLGHYLSSCSTSAQTSRDDQDTPPTEPREEEGTALSEVNVSAWTQEDSLPPQQQTDQEQPKNKVTDQQEQDDDASRVSAFSLQTSIRSVDVEATTPRKKPNIQLDPTEFASPITTTKRNSLDVALDEGTQYAARIDELQAELIKKDEAMNQLRAHYEQQLEQLHQYTLPLQPHSPYDASNNKYSPDTQNKKLIERNQTLAKEVRFADQTCVELSGRNTALVEKLQMREQELYELRQEYEDLAQKVLNSKRSNDDSGKLSNMQQELQQANEDKRALEEQLHHALDKLVGKDKEIQALQEKHALELEDLQSSPIKDLRKQIQALEFEKERLKCEVRDNSERTKEAESALSATKDELVLANRKMDAVLRDLSSTSWKLRDSEQRLQEAKDLKAREESEKKRAQEEATYWRAQVESRQKKVEEAAPQAAPRTEGTDNETPEAVAQIITHAKKSEQDYRCIDKEFTTQVEKDLSEVHSALSALAVQFEILGGNEVDRHKTDCFASENRPSAKIDPSSISKYLASSQNSKNEMLSPQIIQVLQLILSFTQQHLDVLDKQVATVTSEYGSRLTKLHHLVEYIRSSLVFETESDERSTNHEQEGTSRGNGTSTKEDDNMLDATFAAVTSIPDKKVELMEEARSPPKPAPSNIAIPVEHGSPARDTIMDLSKIEAVNSPFYSSQITFSLGSEGGKHAKDSSFDHTGYDKAPRQKLELRSVQKNVFKEPLESGRKELERLRETLSKFQKSFWLQRERISSFVESQQKALGQLNAEYSSLSSQERKLVNEKSTLEADLFRARQAHDECVSTIERYTLDLEASQKSEARLRSQYESSCDHIAALEKDITEMEGRLISGSPTKDQKLRDIGRQSEQLRKELFDARKSKDMHAAEIAKLQKHLQESEEAHCRLKVSFATANDKLAAAVEQAEHHQALAQEMDTLKQREASARDKLSQAKKEVRESGTMISSLTEEKSRLQAEKEVIEEQLQSFERENAALKDKYQIALSSYDGTTQEYTSVKAELSTTKLELDRTKKHFEDKVKSTEEKLKAANQMAEELQGQLASALKETGSREEEIQRLRDSLRESDETLEQIKVSYVSSQNQLADALEKTAEYGKLLDEKKALEDRLEKAEQELASRESISEEQRVLRSKFDAAQQELDQLREDLGAKIEAFANSQRETEDLAKGNDRLESRCKGLADELSTVRSELAVLTEAKDNGTAEIDSLREALKQSEDTLEKLKVSYVDCQDKLAEAAEKASVTEELEEKLKILEDGKAQLEQIAKDAQEEIKRKAESISVLDSSNNEVCQERDDLQTRLDAAEKELEQSREAVESLEQLSQFRDAMEKLETEMRRDLKDAYQRNETLSEALKQSDETLEQLKVSYVKVNDKLAEVQDNNTKNEALIEEFQGASEAAEHLTAHTEEQLMDSRNEIEQLRNEKIDLANALAEAEDELIEATEEFCNYRESMETELAERDLALVTAERELEGARDEIENKLVNFGTQIRALRKVISKSLNPSDSEEEDGLVDVESEISRLKTMIPSLCESLSALVDKSEWSDEQLHRINEEVAALRVGLQDEKVVSEELAEQLQEARSKIEYASSKFQKLTKALEEERALHYDDKRKFFWSENARQETQDRFEEVLGIREEDIGKLYDTESQYLELSSKFAKVTDELSTYKHRASAALEELKTKEQALVELQSQKDIWENRCFKLRSYMRKLTEKIQEWETAYELLLEAYKKQKKSKRTATESYAQVRGDAQSRTDLQDGEGGRFMNDLGSFRSVHDQLEEELKQMKIELSNVCWT